MVAIFVPRYFLLVNVDVANNMEILTIFSLLCSKRKKMLQSFSEMGFAINYIGNTTLNSIFLGTTGSSKLKFELLLLEPNEPFNRDLILKVKFSTGYKT